MTDIQAKFNELKAAGKEVPTPDMIKTPEQIAKIREACKLNTAALDLIGKFIKVRMKKLKKIVEIIFWSILAIFEIGVWIVVWLWMFIIRDVL